MNRSLAQLFKSILQAGGEAMYVKIIISVRVESGVEWRQKGRKSTCHSNYLVLYVHDHLLQIENVSKAMQFEGR